MTSDAGRRGRRRYILKISVSSTWPGLPEPLSSDLSLRAPVQQLKARSTLFNVGDPGDGCYRLDKGVLKVVLASAQGEQRILALLPPGAVVGDLSMIDGLPRSALVIAVADSELCSMSQEMPLPICCA